jgi:hypothetical protein
LQSVIGRFKYPDKSLYNDLSATGSATSSKFSHMKRRLHLRCTWPKDEDMKIRHYQDHTIERVQPGDFSKTSPEFGRTKDVERMFGLKRGTLYNLFEQQKVRGCLLRVRGEKSGVRLWDITSIRQFVLSQLGENHSEVGSR